MFPLPARRGQGSKQLAPTHEALERERNRVEVERRRAEVAVKVRDAAEEIGRKAREVGWLRLYWLRFLFIVHQRWQTLKLRTTMLL